MRKITLTIFLTMILSGCHKSGFYEYQLDEDSFFWSGTIKMIEEKTGIDLPEDARGLNFHYLPPIDPSFIAKIEIPEVSKDEVISQISEFKNDEYSSSGRLETKVDWWYKKDASIIISRKSITSYGYLEVFLIDEINKSVLFISWGIV